MLMFDEDLIQQKFCDKRKGKDQYCVAQLKTVSGIVSNHICPELLLRNWSALGAAVNQN